MSDDADITKSHLITEWRKRAEAAEAEVERLRAALKRVSEGQQCWACDEWGVDCGGKITDKYPCSIVIAAAALSPTNPSGAQE